MRQWIFAMTVIVLVGGFSAVVYWSSYDRKSKTGNGQYDERQVRAQGKAYMWGFFAMWIAGIVIFLAEIALDRPVMAPGEAPVLMICCGAAVMAVYCIAKDAYISIHGSRGAVLVSSGLLSGVNLSRGFEKLRESGVLTEGRLGPCWVFFALGSASLAVFVSLAVKMLLERRRGE